MKSTKELPKKEQEEYLRKNPVNLFCCLTCKDSKDVTHKEFVKHLQTVHNIDTKDKKQMQGNRKMLLHMDGDYWFLSEYEWDLECGIKFHQYCKNARDKNDPMRF